MCTWAIAWLLSHDDVNISDSFLGWALFVDLLIFSSFGGGFINLKF